MIVIFAALGVAVTAYAMFLNHPPINQWYTPDWVWLTVAGGNGLILLAILALAFIGELSLWQFWLMVIANVVAGIPIVIWQLIATARRRWVRDSRKRRP